MPRVVVCLCTLTASPSPHTLHHIPLAGLQASESSPLTHLAILALQAEVAVPAAKEVVGHQAQGGHHLQQGESGFARFKKPAGGEQRDKQPATDPAGQCMPSQAKLGMTDHQDAP